MVPTTQPTYYHPGFWLIVNTPTNLFCPLLKYARILPYIEDLAPGPDSTGLRTGVFPTGFDWTPDRSFSDRIRRGKTGFDKSETGFDGMRPDSTIESSTGFDGSSTGFDEVRPVVKVGIFTVGTLSRQRSRAFRQHPHGVGHREVSRTLSLLRKF